MAYAVKSNRNMKYLAILAVFTLACSGEDINPTQCISMITISGANPIQFWPKNCETWNESSPKGVHHYCFCQPFECDDEIKSVFIDDPDLEYELGIYDSDENLIHELPFSETDIIGNNIFPTLSSMRNGSSSGTINWVTGNAPKVTFTGDGQVSKPLEKSTIIPAGKYRLEYQANIDVTVQIISNGFGLNKPLKFYTAGVVFAAFNLSSGSHTIDIDLIQDADKASFRFVSPLSGGNGTTGEIISATLKSITSSYSISFIPSSMDICDEKIQLKILTPLSIPSLASWTNKGVGSPDWTTGATPSIDIITSGGEISDALFSLTPLLENSDSNTFQFDYNVSASGSGPDSNALNFLITLYKDGVFLVSKLQNIGTGTSLIGSIIVDSPSTPDEIWIQAKWTNINPSYTILINSFTVNNAIQTHAASDCIDIKTNHDESLLINYSNHENFDGIEYGDLSPDPSFNLRIPAIFFEDRLIQEGQYDKLSNGQVISLYEESKVQRLLSTDRMPKYMHEKILAVLQHQFLFIDNSYWIKGGEEYAKTEKKNKRDSLSMYTCWLTRQSSLVRNIL